MTGRGFSMGFSFKAAQLHPRIGKKKVAPILSLSILFSISLRKQTTGQTCFLPCQPHMPAAQIFFVPFVCVLHNFRIFLLTFQTFKRKKCKTRLLQHDLRQIHVRILKCLRRTKTNRNSNRKKRKSGRTARLGRYLPQKSRYSRTIIKVGAEREERNLA